MDEERDESSSSVSCSEEIRGEQLSLLQGKFDGKMSALVSSVRNVEEPDNPGGGGVDESAHKKGHHHQRHVRSLSGKGKFLRYKNAGSISTSKLRSNERRIIPSNGTHLEKLEQSSDGGFHNQNQQRRRRRERSNKWKPYHLLSFDERRSRDERETKRAEERRNQLTTLGFPQAPYNTTQFLMNDHKSEHDNTFQEPAILSSDDSNVADPETDVSLDRGYDQEWARVLTANLNLLNKDDLIDYALRTEREKSELERRLRKLELELEHINGSYSDDAAEVSMMEESRPAMAVRAESV